MGWSAIVASALKIFSALASYFQAKQLIDAGKAEANAARSSVERDRIDRANKSRISASELFVDPWDKANDGR